MATRAEYAAAHGPIQYVARRAGERLIRPPPLPLTVDENRRHVMKLYRRVVRSVPIVLTAYQITGGPTLERESVAHIRALFEHNRGVTDPQVAAVLRHKCEMELSESMLLWKTKSHICNLVFGVSAPPVAQLMAKQLRTTTGTTEAKHSAFLDQFYQG